MRLRTSWSNAKRTHHVVEREGKRDWLDTVEKFQGNIWLTGGGDKCNPFFLAASFYVSMNALLNIYYINAIAICKSRNTNVHYEASVRYAQTK